MKQCVCCYNYTVEEEHDICEVCFWEKDITSEENSQKPSGSNGVSLDEARENYKKFGARENRFKEFVRNPYPNERPQCICCYNYTVEKEHDICEVCFWEKDNISERYPNDISGNHHVSLNEARENYKKFGACENQFQKLVRKPYINERPQCACCYNYTVEREYDICEVCFLEKDNISERYPNDISGNHCVSLDEARENYKKLLAYEEMKNEKNDALWTLETPEE